MKVTKSNKNVSDEVRSVNPGHTTTMPDNCTVPEPPAPCIRVGFAGKRWRPESVGDSALEPEPTSVSSVRETLACILDTIEREAIAVGLRFRRGAGAGGFYADRPLEFRLITGLAEGADQLAADTFLAAEPSDVVRRLHAVIPFELDVYRDSRERWFRDDLDAAASRCETVVALDGIYDKPSPDTPLARNRRSRAYRSQSRLLLRQSDILLVITDPEAPTGSGGALETVERALARQIPVIFVSYSGDHDQVVVRLLEPGDDVSVSDFGKTTAAWEQRAQEWVRIILAGSVDEILAPVSDSALIREYFDPACAAAGGTRWWQPANMQKRLWSGFKSWFEDNVEPNPRDNEIEPFASWKKRAVTLNYHYADLYRGVILLNYVFALVAVTIAVVVAAIETGSGQLSAWVRPLVGLQFLAVILIFNNTRNANNHGWNKRTIAYRYLAERLRSCFYLPLAGSLRVPSVGNFIFKTRVLRQSAIDVLFDAMLRQARLHDLTRRIDGARVYDGISGTGHVIVKPRAALRCMREHWIRVQQHYHQYNSRSMYAMNTLLRRLGYALSIGAVAVVGLEVAAWWLPVTIPFTALLAAILPVAAAACQGIRFQSECGRLAERSEKMMDRLRRHLDRIEELEARIVEFQATPECDPGSWTGNVLALAEDIAAEMIQEVAEWSVVYDKEVQDA